jgi:cell division protein FtsA
MKETILAIDIGSSKIATIIANHQDKNIDILAISISNSSGIKKGSIIDIDETLISIRNSINDAKKNLPIDINKTIVTLCGKDVINIKSSGKITLPEKIVTQREINQVLQTALYNASIPNDYEMIHTIPKNFILDDITVINPLNENANSLEVQVNVLVVKKNLLANFRNIFARLNLTNLTFVLNSYSTIFALTDEKQRKNGVSIINIGAETSELICVKENSYIYSGFLAVGSKNITNDLALMLNISSDTAENIKLKYGNLLKDYKNLEYSENRLKLEHLDEALNLSNIQTIVHARVEEILIHLRKKLKDSAYINYSNSGILITGGLANLKGIKELAQKVFDGIPIFLSYPSNLQNRFINLEEYILSSSVGLLNYIINSEDRFELDSNKKLLSSNTNEQKVKELIKTQEPMQKDDLILTPLKQEKISIINGLYKKLLEWF